MLRCGTRPNEWGHPMRLELTHEGWLVLITNYYTIRDALRGKYRRNGEKERQREREGGREGGMEEKEKGRREGEKEKRKRSGKRREEDRNRERKRRKWGTQGKTEKVISWLIDFNGMSTPLGVFTPKSLVIAFVFTFLCNCFLRFVFFFLHTVLLNMKYF